jgi:HAMP domain-containing protein
MSRARKRENVVWGFTLFVMIPIKLGTRLTVALIVPIVLLFAVFGYVQTRVDGAQLQNELEAQGRATTRTIQVAIESALRAQRPADIRRLSDGITGFERVRGIRVFDADGGVRYESAPPERMPGVFPDQLRKLRLGAGTMESRLRVDGAPAVSFLAPIRAASGEFRGAVQVLHLQSFLEVSARSSRDALAALTLALVLAVGAVVFFVIRLSVTRPIDELLQSVQDVRTRDLRSRLPVRTRDELGRLTDEFDAMRARLARRSQLDEQGERRRVEEEPGSPS